MDPSESEIFDKGMQPERTALAWRRTALALLIGAIAAVRILPELLGEWALIPAGAGAAVAVGIMVWAHRRHVTVHRTLTTAGHDRVALPSGALPLTMTLFVVAAGFAALSAVLWTALAH
ncbi:DUF202 domain-containing protein [Microbacterium capsulatum]|uniref:DUF202 domain-containing protein n=1 Tax=Microbacterium capsulatum TaxID=3041921 RepID=A0ABU0XGU3_9MICO|nr:DUF202 domain-containing protein [Microbacterium sp. ASV81]MDQ4214348.1 DUF202 domain-containing protein [Microbacterium sp. ASV81]